LADEYDTKKNIHHPGDFYRDLHSVTTQRSVMCFEITPPEYRKNKNEKQITRSVSE